jgi:penicillin amidase
MDCGNSTIVVDRIGSSDLVQFGQGKNAMRMLFALIVICGFGVATVLPVRATELALPKGCPYKDIRIEFDDYEVPTIHADSVEAALFGAGYAQAHHRLVQLDVTRRMGRGELAAFVGEGFLASDREMRRLRLDEVANESLELYTESERAFVDAYSAGVNFYIENCAELPAEFLLSGAPRAWTASDTLVCAKVMSWMLMDDFFTTMYWDRVKDRVEPGLYDLVNLPGLESTITHVSENDLPSELLAKAGSIARQNDEGAGDEPLPHPGSNCFVVSGDLTADGQPWLASDPHLELTFPAVWYEMRYDAPGLNARGMSVPGTPIIAIGANDYVAWGITALGGDVADAVRYPARGIGTTNPEYQTIEGWKPFETVEAEYEIMALGGKRTEKETLLYTEVGPVFYSDDQSVTALQWVGMLPDREGAAFLALNRAWEILDVPTAVNEMTTSQNLLFCTADNHIGYIAAGKYPVRAYDGSVVVDGSLIDAKWRRFLTSYLFPYVIDPECGYIVSANQQVYPLDAVFPLDVVTGDMLSDNIERALGGFRSYGHRAARITALIADARARGPIAPADIARIQCDTYSTLGAGFRDFAVKTLDAAGYAPGAPDSIPRAAYAMLRDWDARCDADSAGACVAFLMLEKVADRILAPRGYRTTYERAWNGGFDFGRKLGHYWDDPKTEQVEDAAMILAWVLEESAAHLETTLGAPDNWRWDNFHFMDLSYPVPILGSFAPGLVGSPGGYDTPWQGSSAMNDRGMLVQTFAPSMRMIASPGNSSGAFMSVLPGGQSGKVTDPHSRDQLALYLKGEYKGS